MRLNQISNLLQDKNLNHQSNLQNKKLIIFENLNQRSKQLFNLNKQTKVLKLKSHKDLNFLQTFLIQFQRNQCENWRNLQRFLTILMEESH